MEEHTEGLLLVVVMHKSIHKTEIISGNIQRYPLHGLSSRGSLHWLWCWKRLFLPLLAFAGGQKNRRSFIVIKKYVGPWRLTHSFWICINYESRHRSRRIFLYIQNCQPIWLRQGIVVKIKSKNNFFSY